MTKKKKRSGRNRELAKEIAKKPFEFVVYLFSEGETEVRYLKDLSKGKNVQVVRCGMDATPWSLMRTARKWAFLNRRRIGKGSGIWVIFDDDEKNADIAKTVAELGQLPKGCNKKSAMPVINVGYMKPCIELWGAMCVLGNANGLPQMHGQMESRLKVIMRGYDHDTDRYFDVKQMVKTTEAIKLAMSWVSEFGEFSHCVGSAAHYAGIAPLVSKIGG